MGDVKADFAANVMTTYGRYPLVITHGSGTSLFDENGKEYIDFAAGIATCALGHANPKLVNAITEQMGKIHHCSNLYYIPEQGRLAKWIVDNSCADKVFFCNSGAESNEAAIKLARKYAHTKLGLTSPVIITALSSFHGRTLAAITATGQPKYQANFGPLPQGFEYVTYNDVEGLKALVQEIQARGNGEGVAAIMMESLQGEGGIRPGEPEFFREIRRICDETGALMICDEVQTGVGRTGKMWGYENLGGTQPDVFTSAKALGGGVPLGAMACRDFCDVFAPGDHASTYGGNPLACAAGLAIADAFDSDGLLRHAQERGEQLGQLIAGLKAKYPTLVADVRGWGLMRGLELTEECGLTAASVTQELMDNGLLVVPAGPRVVRFVPPLVVSAEVMADAVARLDAALVKLAQ
jgi:acetylornithine aminotransferase